MGIPFVEATGGPVPKGEDELNLAGAGGSPTGEQIQSVIILSEKLPAGTQNGDTISDVITGPDEAETLAGEGSPAACLARFFMTFKSNKVGKPKAKVRLALLNAEATGTAAVQTITFVTVPSADGTWVFQIGRYQFNLNVRDQDSVDTMAAAFVLAFNAAEIGRKLPLLATSALGVVTLTATCKTADVNSIGLETVTDPDVSTTATWSGSYMGDGSGTGTAGIGVQAANLTDILIAIRGNSDCASIVTSWQDDATLELLIDEANDRANAINKIPTYLYCANNAEAEATKAAARAAQITWSTGLDSDDAHRVSAGGVFGTGDWHGFAACFMAALRAAEPHLARSLNGLEDDGAPVPSASNRYNEADLALLLEAGFNPFYVHQSKTKLGMCRHVMCRDSWGVKDFSKIQVPDLVRQRVSFRYGLVDRPSIVADDAELPSAPHVTKPKYLIATAASELHEMQDEAYLTDVDSLLEAALSELNGTEVRQAFPIQVVEQLHNRMTRYDVNMG